MSVWIEILGVDGGCCFRFGRPEGGHGAGKKQTRCEGQLYVKKADDTNSVVLILLQDDDA